MNLRLTMLKNVPKGLEMSDCAVPYTSTPRTDKVCGAKWGIIDVNFARQLERELQAAVEDCIRSVEREIGLREELSTARAEIDKLRTRLTVLERVRDAAEKLPMYEPNHDHRVAGHWDSDGAPCRICAARKEFLESLAAARGKE